ncbi:hypothetical protein EBB07_19400 [Paenibacillaceae bacterium]|nr:hypothetical protein EBB07_19400 [Paenibacillaceae bacterium]
MMKHVFKVGTLIVLLMYFVLMVIGLSRGTLTMWTGVLMTLIAGSLVAIIYWFSKLLAYVNRRLYEELRRMMK